MSVVLLIVGVLISTFTAGYIVYTKRTTTDATANSMSQVVNALGNFLIQQGRYPCPARADVGRDSPEYGIEGDCADTSVAVGSCANGICIEESTRAMGSSTPIDILLPGSGMSAFYTANNWTCGTPSCNYAEYLMYLYTNKPSIYCPSATPPTSLMISGHDLCTVPGMVNYFNSFYPNWLSASTGTATGGGSHARVRRGSVPFRTLNIPEKAMSDGYRMHLDYAVTELLAVVTSYNKDNGGISVIDNNDKSLVTPPASAHFVVISHGEDRKGGYTQHGQQYGSCPTGQRDGENCNTLTDDRAIYRAAPVAKVGAPGYYDDLVQYYTAVETPLWKVADSAGFNIHDLVNAGLPGGGKIGISSSTPSVPIDVAGNIAASGQLMVSEICDASSNCFTPEKIAGDQPEMDCTDPGNPDYDATKPYLIGISGGKAVCGDVVDFKCPAGQLMKGINPSGGLICTSTVACPVTPVTACSTTLSLPASFQGQLASLSFGSTGLVTRNYTCNASGVWQLTSSTGSCTCTPVDTGMVPYTCTALKATGVSTWTGMGTRRIVRTCPSGVVTTTDNIDSCSCSPATKTLPGFSCPSGFVGSITKKQDWTCSSSTAGSWGIPYTISNSCTCVPGNLTDNPTCPTAHTGIWTRHNSFLCPAGTWTGWIDDINTCTCTGASEDRTVACGSGYVGTKTQTRTYDCPANVWGAWLDNDVSACLAVTYAWSARSMPTSSSIKGPGAQVGSTCSILGNESPCWGYNAGSGYDNYPACTCE